MKQNKKDHENCMLFFYLVLSWISFFHITEVTYSTRQNNNWIIKMTPFKCLPLPLNLNTMCHFLDDPRLFLYFVIVVHESFVGPEQKNPPASSAYLNPFQKWLYDFEIHLFTLRVIEGLIDNYYKRCKHLLMLKKATQYIKRQGM